MRGAKYLALAGVLLLSLTAVACSSDDKKSSGPAELPTVAGTATPSVSSTPATPQAQQVAPTTAAPAPTATTAPAPPPSPTPQPAAPPPPTATAIPAVVVPPTATPQPAAPPPPTATPNILPTPTPQPAAPSGTNLSVTGGGNLQFSPSSFSVKAGQRVNISFSAVGAPHSFTIDGLADTGIVSPGGSGSASFTPLAAGTLSFYCRVHGASVMGGQITVTP